jgi:hypothetical protein
VEVQDDGGLEGEIQGSFTSFRMTAVFEVWGDGGLEVQDDGGLEGEIQGSFTSFRMTAGFEVWDDGGF